MGKSETLPTISEIPDDLWEQIHPVILEIDPPKANPGRHHFPDARRLPVEPSAPGTGDDSTIHRTFQRWVELGLLERIWAMLVEECEELGGVDWEWQVADCAMGKARFGGIQSIAPPRTGARRAASGAFWLTRTGGR